MAYIHEIAAGNFEWSLQAAALLVGILREDLVLYLRRGFGRGGFGRGRGSFRLIRIPFVLLFTTLLGPIVLVALLAFAAYAFFNSRRGR
ncbi:MAG TPA: hypothetical protein VF206_01895 [Rubrobacter sp.]